MNQFQNAGQRQNPKYIEHIQSEFFRNYCVQRTRENPHLNNHSNNNSDIDINLLVSSSIISEAHGIYLFFFFFVALFAFV